MKRFSSTCFVCGMILLLLQNNAISQSTTTVTEDYVEMAENRIVTNLPGNFTLGTNVNDLIGANRFYNAGFSGQNTIAANVEAGHVWNGHESLIHVNQYAHATAAFGTTTSDLFDRHATWVASHIGGRETLFGGQWQVGIAPNTELRSGAIAAAWGGTAYSTSFSISASSFNGGYAPFFGVADVINSSWGGVSPAGDSFFAVALDGFAAQNSQTTLVASAGNSGPASNTVGYPGAGYNAITVAALSNGGNNAYNTIASFSSRGPQDYSDPVNGVRLAARAAVDIAAPGTNLHAAFYGGQTGGNNTTLAGSTNISSSTALYSAAVQGTSFASPIVAGGVGLLKSASYNTPEMAGNTASRDTLVVKSVLMNSAEKTIGWNNGQIANVQGGVDTTQALDYVAGAGAMNLDRAFDQYVMAGTRDVLGLMNGNLGTVATVGWDLGNVLLGQSNLYSIGGLLQGGSLFNVTLNWFRDRAYDPGTFTAFDIGQADLTLEVTDLLSNTVISRSSSLYNTSEHLSFVLPNTSQYGVRVNYGSNTFGSLTNVNYGIAWSGISAIPEPSAVMLLLAIGSLVTLLHRQRAAVS